MNPYSLRKTLRALEIARLNRLPVVNLVESGGADLPTQADLFVPGRADLPRPHRAVGAGASRRSRSCSATRPPAARTCRACATTRCWSTERAKVFLGGPPLVKMATGEDADDEALGGADMHARVSGLADYFAVDEHDAIRIGRADRGPAQLAQARARAAAARRTSRCYDPEELLGIAAGRPPRCRSTRARCSPASSTAPSSTSTSRSTARRWSPAGRRLHGYPGRRPRQRTAACCSARRPRRPPSSSCWPTRPTRRWCSCRTPPATWSAPSTSRAASSRTAPR